MRRFRACLAGLLSVWLPIDAAVAGWWHHHHAQPVFVGPLPIAPCGGPPAPWAGWEHAVVIDDRPLFAPAPAAFVVAAPAVEVFLPIAPVVAEYPIHEEVIVAGYDVTGPVVDTCTCDANDVVLAIVSDDGAPAEGTVTGSYEWTTDVAEDVAPAPEPVPAPGTETPQRVGTTPQAPLAPPSEPLPKDPAPPAAPAPVAGEKPAAEQPASVLEPREPVTLQGESAEPLDEADGFEPPATDDDGDDEPMADDADAEVGDDEGAMEDSDTFEGPATTDEDDDDAIVKEPAAPAKGAARNLFDEVPGDETAPEMDDDAPPADAFEAPDDDGFGIPDEPPMDEGFEAPADDMPADDMPADDDGFEAPAGEPMEEEAADDEIGDEIPADEAPAGEEPAADPFDSSSIRVPAGAPRTWQDDSGRFSTEGHLVEIRAGSVRILKTTGRHTTVPMARLSAADRAHVAGVRRALATSQPAPADTAGIR